MTMPTCCGFCKKYIPIKTAGKGLCSAPDLYFEVDFSDECHYFYNPKTEELTCGDCARYGNDTACFTVESEDSAHHSDGTLCGGFISKFSYDVDIMLWKLFCSHEGDKEEVLNDVAERMAEFELPCEKREIE